MHKVYEPYLPKKSTEYAKDAINSGWISWIGDYTEKSTSLLSELSGVKYPILVNNGTSATHLTTIALRYFFPEIKNIIVPSSCYVAAYNSILYEGVWDAQCYDLDLKTWNFSVQEVPESSAILAVHNLGNIINVPKLSRMHNCPIIEDNCEGMFGSYEGKPSGSESIASSMSFFGNKNITTGEGGAFFTNDKSIYDFINKVKGQGQSEKRYIHDCLGYNYRMTNVQAAILLGQLEEYDQIKSKKQNLFNRYKSNLSGFQNIKLQQEEVDTVHSNWMFAVRFPGLDCFDTAERYFLKQDIETRPMFYPYVNHKHINFSGPYSVADKLQKEIVIFPSHTKLKNIDIDQICSKIISFSEQIKIS